LLPSISKPTDLGFTIKVSTLFLAIYISPEGIEIEAQQAEARAVGEQQAI
jgi:hypothetical protein